MASIKFSAAVADIRGKVGGVVFQRNKNGAFMRTLRKPTMSKSQWSIYFQGNISHYSRKWATLSDSDRQSWKDASIQFPQTNRVGDVVFLTGYQLYQKTNQNLEVAGYD